MFEEGGAYPLAGGLLVHLLLLLPLPRHGRLAHLLHAALHTQHWFYCSTV